uniref:Uncharacterized protein n=1 Tax=Glossina pallidipes TaxID=7398 RepID=A0A1A9ZSQ5_GLOPL
MTSHGTLYSQPITTGALNRRGIIGIALADILIGVARHAARTLIDSGSEASFVPHPYNLFLISISVSSFFISIDLINQLLRFWELVEVSTTSVKSEQDAYYERPFLETTRRDANRRYIVCLLFRMEYPDKLTLGRRQGHRPQHYRYQSQRQQRHPDQ